MAKRKTDTPSEAQVIQTVDQKHEQFDERTEQLNDDAQDAETTRQTNDSLDLTATTETADAVEQAMDGAQETIAQDFSDDSEKLDMVQDESQEYEGQLNDMGDSVDRDLSKVSDASSRLNSERAQNEYLQVKETLVRGKEFLDEQENRAQDARENSERQQQELQDRLNAARGS